MSFIGQLARFAPAKIVYVSCGPDTQARDAAELQKFGYRLEKLQPFDLFPPDEAYRERRNIFKTIKIDLYTRTRYTFLYERYPIFIVCGIYCGIFNSGRFIR